jgi:hypothetical protein
VTISSSFKGFCQEDSPDILKDVTASEIGLPKNYQEVQVLMNESDSIISSQFIVENYPESTSLSGQPVLGHPEFSEKIFHSGDFPLYLSTLSHSLSVNSLGNIANRYSEPQVYRFRNQDASIWKKMGRAELFIGGTELICMGILMALPKEVTKWEPGFMNDAMRNIKRAFTTMPENDEDGWGFNYVGHPIAGSLYYNSIRSQGATIFQSFLFSFAQSAFWEYVIEGAAEQPSLQDMLITPIFGTLLGEASHVATLKMRRNGFNWIEKITVIILNPFYPVNNSFRTTNRKKEK